MRLFDNCSKYELSRNISRLISEKFDFNKIISTEQAILAISASK